MFKVRPPADCACKNDFRKGNELLGVTRLGTFFILDISSILLPLPSLQLLIHNTVFVQVNSTCPFDGSLQHPYATIQEALNSRRGASFNFSGNWQSDQFHTRLPSTARMERHHTNHTRFVLILDVQVFGAAVLFFLDYSNNVHSEQESNTSKRGTGT